MPPCYREAVWEISLWCAQCSASHHRFRLVFPCGYTRNGCRGSIPASPALLPPSGVRAYFRLTLLGVRAHQWHSYPKLVSSTTSRYKDVKTLVGELLLQSPQTGILTATSVCTPLEIGYLERSVYERLQNASMELSAWLSNQIKDLKGVVK